MPEKIDGPTQLHPFGLKTSPPDAQAQDSMRERQSITVFSLEVFGKYYISNPSASIG